MSVAPATALMAAATRRKRKWKDAELEGQTVAGRYAVSRLIARGGMGEVYEAHDQVLRRDVAIKVVRSGDDPTLMDRFNREAYLAARFDHPHIVRVFDLGHTDDGCPFLVMELLRGKLFSQLLAEEGTMDPARVAELLEGVSEALDRVHQEGVVHRDIKLENLMLVEREDGTVRAKLLDFGVALPPSEEAPRLTVDGSFVGTPLYSPPEALFGVAPDARGDIYSLGVVAYQLLTGTAPFQHLETQSMLRAKVSDDVPPPSHLRPDLDPAVDELFASVLAREAAQRPARASDLVRGLVALAASRPDREPSTPRRHHFITAGAAAFVLAGLVLWIAAACSTG
jgi:serine/threonine-protein kinase